MRSIATSCCAAAGSLKSVPSRAPDIDRLRAFYADLSPSSRSARFFGRRPEIAQAELAAATQQDPSGHVALVATSEQQFLGVAEYYAADRVEADAALVVDDDNQHAGIATVLLEDLAAIARGPGSGASTPQPCRPT